MSTTATNTTAPPSRLSGQGTESKQRRTIHPLVNLGVVVAVLGLLFTVGTYWVDQRSQERQDERQARGALTEVTGQITSLPRAYVPLLDAAHGTELMDLQSGLNTETVVLLARAETLISEYPSIARSSDHYALGDAYTRIGSVQEAYDNYGKAEALADEGGDDYTLELAARRSKGATLFALGRADEGRLILAALVADTASSGLPEATALSQKWFTLMFWTRTEAAWGQCVEVMEPLRQLGDLATGANATYRDQLEAVARVVRTACGG